jgi:PKD repeat protein
VANFNIPNPDGCFPINVGHFNASSNANGYFWDFGDGDTSDDGSPYHFYDEPGAYTVTLIASNNLGCSDTLAVDSAVFAFPRPVAGFTPEVIPGETSSEYFLNNTSVGATDFFWTFGNGEFSELFEPTYDYPDHGDYRIILFASNQYGCDDSASFSVTVDLISELHVPNAMVVGENGEAGLFLPKGVGLGQYHVWVFDQWGNQLWESTALSNGSPAEGWDGYYNGMTVPQGAYTWRINAVFKDGEVWGGVERPGGNKTIVGSVMVLY